MVDIDEFFISLAIDRAWESQLLTYPNPAVGAVVTDRDRLLSINTHKRAGEPHAEVEAIRDAYFNLTNDSEILKLTASSDIHNYLYQNHNNIFINSTIYVTLEPCNHYGKTPPCSKLIESLKFKRVVVAVRDFNSTGGVERLKRAGVDVKVGVLGSSAKELLYPFLKWREGNFTFFKLAQSLNGVVTGGYISCAKSLDFVHKLRDRVELLAIGGESVRVDRPKLDTRRIENGRNPDILIYSREKKFDKSIPLFQIEDREVFIESSLDRLESSNFTMIEGGVNMLNALKDRVDMVLTFTAPKYIDREPIKSNIEFEYIKTLKSGVDLKLFSKIKLV